MEKKLKENLEKLNKKKFLNKKVPSYLIMMPIVLIFASNSLFYFLFSVASTYLCHKDYYVIESDILKQLFADQFSDLTSSTLISSPIQTYILLLLQGLNFIFPNKEVYLILTIITIILSYRFRCFYEIYSLNTIKDFESPQELNDATNKKGTKKQTNPLKNDKDFEIFNDYSGEDEDEEDDEDMNNPGDKKTKAPNLTELKNSFNKNYITQKMLSACLIVIGFDFIFLLTFAFPLSFGSSLLRCKGGFILFLFNVVSSISYDTCETIWNKKFHSNFILKPIYEKKTPTGIFVGSIVAFIVCFFIRMIIVTCSSAITLEKKSFLVFIFLLLSNSLTGEFVYRFLEKCAESHKEKQTFKRKKPLRTNIIVLHKIALAIPVCRFFADKF